MIRQRSQLSPVNSRESHSVVSIAPSTASRNWDDAKFFRLCLVYDSRIKVVRTNWSRIFGLGIATAISLTLWLGLGFVIARFF
jgi:hypothetical protein